MPGLQIMNVFDIPRDKYGTDIWYFLYELSILDEDFDARLLTDLNKFGGSKSNFITHEFSKN